jgi:hypothetical protein
MDFRPRLTGNRDTDETLRQTFDAIYQLRAQVDAIPAPSPVPTFYQIRTQLQAGGSAPMDVTGLLGAGGGKIPVVPVLPSSGSDGDAVIYLNALWTWNHSRWEYRAGVMESKLASRPSTLGFGGVGFLHWSTDYRVWAYWDGSRWIPFDAQGFVDTHANRRGVTIVDTSGTAVSWVSGPKFTSVLASETVSINYLPFSVATFTDDEHLVLGSSAGSLTGATLIFQRWLPWFLPLNTTFRESDQGLTYVVRDATGFVDTAGTAVTISSSPASFSKFNPRWTGLGIVIAGVTYTIASVTSPSALVLTSSAGSQASVAYTLPSGAWRYSSGECLLATLVELPTDLWSDDLGALYQIFDYAHRYVWIGTSWSYAPGDPGSGWYSFLYGVSGGRWYPAAGGQVLSSHTDGTLSLIDVKDISGEVFLMGSGGSANQAAATSANWNNSAVTEPESAHTHGIPSQANHTHGITPGNANTGAGANATPATTDADGAHDHGGNTATGSAHTHSLGANAVLLPPSEANGGLPLRIGLAWYVRL